MYMTIVIEGRLPSWNKFYAGVHHTERTRIVRMWHMLVANALQNIEYEMYEKPVLITVTGVFKQGPYPDADNLCAKIVIDGLKGKLIKDDTPQYVDAVTTRTMKGKMDMVVLTIGEMDGSTL